MKTLGELIRPCGPVLDADAAARARERLDGGAASTDADKAWDALAPVFAASPYLSGLATRAPERLATLLRADPAASLERILEQTAALAINPAGPVEAPLRRLKGELHLLTAIADLGGVWDLVQLTGALSRFAEGAVAAALAQAAREGAENGWLTTTGDDGRGPAPGFFAVAMGKLGAFELNYSSDIDISLFYEPEALPLTGRLEPARAAQRLAERISQILQSRTADGYVFRVDMRLRPDPLSTPPAVSVPGALVYYQNVGQNWERAAFIKARPLAGDLPRAAAFLDELQAFVWRRSLDFAAIADIQSIKGQIHAWKVDDRLTARGADLKLGRGGIREIEFYAQTLQLIHGGRDPSLRARGTVAALEALSRADRISREAAVELEDAYTTLRRLEHRAQMIADDQTHRLPEADGARRAIAALDGFDTLRKFDTLVTRTLRTVNRRYGELFSDAEPLSSRHGSLVFTGVEDDPETLSTIARMGFSDPARVSHDIRSWHHGRIRATRSPRERELLTRLAPRLLAAAEASGAADAAFTRFGDFFCALPSSVQIQSLFLAHPDLLDLLVRVLAFAPGFARTLAQRPAVLDSLLDPSFSAEIGALPDVVALLARTQSFEEAMDEARRLYAESAFRIGAQVLAGRASSEAAGRAFADLADALIAGLAPAALAETERMGGALEGETAVVALGTCGAREMTARSDLDLMTLYAPAPGAASAIKGWAPETFYARFTQRLIAALSALTPAGGLYKVDLQLRPSGSAGPVAVSLAAFERYYEAEAETWELLALCKARVVWASTPQFGARAARAIEDALRRPRDSARTAADVIAMRELMARERPAWGEWDLKLAPGGFVDIEFCAQHLQIVGAADGGPLRQNTGEALETLSVAQPELRAALADLKAAWLLQRNLAQLLKIALEDPADPTHEPAGFRRLLARAGGARTFPQLERRLAQEQRGARTAFGTLVG
ncbi:MAG TPA: bifunctional [glutamine synthetase] adenylyltransferase/[glutamine synthetase]-adenylyl-L-tyrosine phosphorylase [Caulobacteraceae bacterium]